ncbi:MAG: magnesium/cobalt transporter CorA [Pseudomonadota bacterium]
MLINCTAYLDGKKLRDIPVEDISDYIELPDHFVWVALNDANAVELAQMKEEFNLHELAVEDASHGHQRPKIEEYGESLFAVLHMIDVVNGELVLGELDIFVAKNYVLSVRSRSKHGFSGVRERCEHEPYLLKQGSAFVFYALIDAVVDRYFQVVSLLENELDVIEEQIFTKGVERTNIESLYQLKRKLTILKHAVNPLMEAVGKLYGGRVPAICSKTQEYFRDVYDHLYRINSAIDSIRDSVATAIQVSLSMLTIDQTEVNKQLAAWAAIFAVATAFAGIWGMNFEHIPELKWRYGYLLALGLIGVSCAYLYYRFKKSGWL